MINFYNTNRVLEISKLYFFYIYIWISLRILQYLHPVNFDFRIRLQYSYLKLIASQLYLSNNSMFFFSEVTLQQHLFFHTCLLIICLYNGLWFSWIFDICVWVMVVTICYYNAIIFSYDLFIKLTFSLTMLLNMITQKKTMQLMNMWRNL